MLLAIAARNWWAVMIRGVLAVLFGLAALFLPGLTLRVLVVLFGAYVLLDGIFAIAAAIQAIGQRRSFGLLLFEGIVSVIAGVLTFFYPALTALVLLYFIGAWAIITGISEIVQAVELRRLVHNEWLLILGGVASVVFGLLAFVLPGVTALTLVWLIGIYAIVFGVALIGLSLRLRGLQQRVLREGVPPMTPAY